MSKNNQLLSHIPLICSILLLSACGQKEVVDKPQQKMEQTTSANIEANSTTKEIAKVKEESKVAKDKEKKKDKIEEISWDNLIPQSYDPSEIIDKYSEQLGELTDDDPKAMVLYGKIQAELDNAPVNMSLDGKTIKMPGFIAPLENNNGMINEFLLVPYFGACIHVPAPPVNQTVMIKVKKGQGIKSEDSSLPVWIIGKLKAVEERTSIGAAGYRIENAKVEPYEEE